MNDEIDELIRCEYGGCTLGAPCANHLAYRTLPEPVHTAVAALVARREALAEKRGREAELRILDHAGVSETVITFIERHNKQRRAALTTEATQGGKGETDE